MGYVKIAFTRGDERTVGFNIELSEDNTTWNTVFTGSSSGLTADLQRFDFTDTNARFVRINVTSNSQKNTASLKEVEVWGGVPIGEEPPPGPPPPGPDPAFIYINRKHVYHVNYDAGQVCGPGAGPDPPPPEPPPPPPPPGPGPSPPPPGPGPPPAGLGTGRTVDDEESA